MATKTPQSQPAGMTDFAEGDVRVVTPGNPLVVNEDPANFGAVQIAGGEVIVQVKSTVTFASLEKKS
ncbi:hypothetical protein SAMN05518845_115133 [Variovorax sp. YR750]|uniref:hypothetical protein n=1 Tax=Variovorax sp. YR750 TaxID=1884384 RepID=UPI0008B71741|nr:hypothetical protein [Variovorax sp. YR750]SEM05581.1 hypothetical protein SAMN05518845_115133 [Variovorax sp. YR750]